VGNLARLGVAAIVSIGLGAALWGVLQPGFSVDPGISAGAAAGLAGVAVALGAVWAAQGDGGSDRKSGAHRVSDTGTLEAVTTFFTDRTDEWADIQAKVRAATTLERTCAAFMIYGMPGVGKSEFAKHAAHKFVAEFSRHVRRADLEMLARQVELHGLEGLERTDPKVALRALLPDSADPAIERIVELCDYLPLAIELAVTRLARKPGILFADRLAQLEAAPNLLLEIDEDAGRRRDGVVRSFELSYGQLPDMSKRVLRLLALAPIPTISISAAAVLTDFPVDLVRATLRELDGEALVSEVEHGGSYRMHDLIRRYGQNLASRDDPAENEAAVSRLLAYYWDAAAQADTLLSRQPTPEAIEHPVPSVRQDLPNWLSIISWNRAELSNLLACADYAVVQAEDSDGHKENVWVMLFAGALAGILRSEGQWRRSIDLQTQAAKSAEKIQVPLGVANALSERGMLYRLTGELDSAAADLDRAISIYRQVGGTAGQIGEAHALNTYGVVLDQLKRQDESQQRLNAALEIFRRSNDPLGQANILHDQGMAEFFADNFDASAVLIEQSLDLYRTVDQPLGMAHAYSNLARVSSE
jgi:tetratricopeptide (TPR) repeat protein